MSATPYPSDATATSDETTSDARPQWLRSWHQAQAPTGEPFRLRLQSITLDGTVHSLPPSGVTAIVGGNNSGKSTLLRQVEQQVSNPQVPLPTTPHVCEEVTTARQGSLGDFGNWLNDNKAVSLPEGQEPGVYESGIHLSLSNAASLYDTSHTGHINQLAILRQTPFDRASILNPVADPRERQFSNSPLPRLARNKELRRRFFEVSEELFGLKLNLDDRAPLQLKVGNLERFGVQAWGDADTDFIAALEQLPGLHQQGDGVTSALGIVATLLTTRGTLVLLDEPEAFLHPPQARSLGRWISRISSERGIQVVLSTHDKNLLLGLADTPTPRLTVLHIRRDGETTTGILVDETDLAPLLIDPYLRTTNALDALFHDATVIVEGHRDGIFYAATIDHLVKSSKWHKREPELLWLGSSGKAAMPLIASTLAKLGAKVVVVPDFDMINDIRLLGKTVLAVGGQWSTTRKSEWASVIKPINDSKHEKTCAAALADIQQILQATPGASVSHKLRGQIESILDSPSAWDQVKRFGMTAVPDGKVTQLVSELDSEGVVLVIDGELESFGLPGGPPKGPEWLSWALKAGIQANDKAQEQARRILCAAGLA